MYIATTHSLFGSIYKSMEALLLYSFLFITIILYIIALIRRPTLFSAVSRRPPGPLSFPIVGSLFSVLDGHPHRALARLAEIHGPIMNIKLGAINTVVISSPDAAKQVLHKKDQYLSSRWLPDAVRILRLSEKSLLWQPANGSWKQLKGICTTHLFSYRNLEATKCVRQQKLLEMVAYLQMRNGQPVELRQLAFGVVLDLISNMLFRKDLSSDVELRNLIFRISEEAAKTNISDIFPVIRKLDIQGRRRSMIAYMSKLLVMINDIVEQRLRSCNANASVVAEDFLDILIKMHMESKIDRDTISALLVDLLAAGTDTTSITLERAMAELLSNPTKLSKAEAELSQLMKQENATIFVLNESHISSLPYLQSVVKEVLRLHPAGPLMLPHMATEDVHLGGYLVHKGTRVLVNVWAIGRDRRYWKDPNVFMPERFFEKNVDIRSMDLELIPFGTGRRSCPGMPMALRHLHLMLGTLLLAFHWRLPQGMEASDVNSKERIGASLAMAVPLCAVPISKV